MMTMVDFDWYEDGVLIERDDWDENENGPFEVSYEAGEAEEENDG